MDIEEDKKGWIQEIQLEEEPYKKKIAQANAKIEVLQEEMNAINRDIERWQVQIHRREKIIKWIKEKGLPRKRNE